MYIASIIKIRNMIEKGEIIVITTLSPEADGSSEQMRSLHGKNM